MMGCIDRWWRIEMLLQSWDNVDVLTCKWPSFFRTAWFCEVQHVTKQDINLQIIVELCIIWVAYFDIVILIGKAYGFFVTYYGMVVHQEWELWHTIGVGDGEVGICLDHLLLLFWSLIFLVWGIIVAIAELAMRGKSSNTTPKISSKVFVTEYSNNVIWMGLLLGNDWWCICIVWWDNLDGVICWEWEVDLSSVFGTIGLHIGLPMLHRLGIPLLKTIKCPLVC